MDKKIFLFCVYPVGDCYFPVPIFPRAVSLGSDEASTYFEFRIQDFEIGNWKFLSDLYDLTINVGLRRSLDFPCRLCFFLILIREKPPSDGTSRNRIDRLLDKPDRGIGNAAAGQQNDDPKHFEH